MENALSTKKYDADSDILRVLAAAFVVFAHVTGTGSNVALCYNGFARFGVPLFVIISGRYMLGKEIKLEKLAKKCVKFFCIMIVWAAIFYIYYSVVYCRPETPLIKFLLTEPYHLWYIWTLIGLYALTPMLHIFCEHASKGIYSYVLLLFFALGPVINIIKSIDYSGTVDIIMDSSKIPNPLGFVFCYLLGDYIRRYDIKLPLLPSALLFLAGTTATLALTFATSTGIGTENALLNETYLSLYSPNVLIASIGMHHFVNALMSGKTSNKYIHLMSDATFGIYLMHPLMFNILTLTPFVTLPIPSLIYFPLCCLLVLAASTAVTLLMMKIPGLRAMVR